MNRKDLLIRQNEGRRKIEGYVSQLSGILDTVISKTDFIDVESTDELRLKFYESYKASSKSFNRSYTVEEALKDDIETLKHSFQERQAYLITKLSEVCGAVIVPAISAIDNYKSIIELDGDSLNLILTDDKTCIYIDCYEEDGSFFHELSIWNM